MKKTLSILISIILVFTLLGCSGEKNEKKESPNSKQDVPAVNPPSKEEVVTENTISFFKSVPDDFVFSVGTGGWKTVITINDDGTFTGEYTDNDFTSVGEGYSEGSIYICKFSGKFSEPIPLDEYTIISTVEKLEYEGKEDEFYIENNIRYIYSVPYGLEEAKEVIFYLPGAEVSGFPEGILEWVPESSEIKETLPENMFLLVNMEENYTFVGKNN